ncbi:hypothetical protein P12x_002244 [Tundrisphaera lichenicola]|uniref:hypothetical protein n=1 Tax=Tundrisphaera lichenicola TaxID=2029860 RepID=UPI003EBE1B7D
MVQVKANEAIMSVIGTLKVQERAEILDDRGMVVGYLISVDSPEDQLRRKAFAAYASGEYQRRKASSEGGKRYTTEQVLEHLRSLGTS